MESAPTRRDARPWCLQERLLSAISSVPAGAFTKEELSRNSMGSIHVFRHVPGAPTGETSYCTSTMPKFHRDVVVSAF